MHWTPLVMLHIPPILPTHIVQRMADLPQRVGLDGLHQRFEHVAAIASGVLKIAQAVAVVDLLDGRVGGIDFVGVAGFA